MERYGTAGGYNPQRRPSRSDNDSGADWKGSGYVSQRIIFGGYLIPGPGMKMSCFPEHPFQTIECTMNPL